MLSLEYLADLLERNRAAAQAQVREFSIGARPFRFNSQPAIMGVINLSPDSWYRESVSLSAEAAIRRGKVLTAQGADIIDLGAESTLAHAARIDETTQSDRLIPIVKSLSACQKPNVRFAGQPRIGSIARTRLGAPARSGTLWCWMTQTIDVSLCVRSALCG
jgi:hypothetical protein